MRTRLLRSSTFRLALIYMALFGASVLLLLGFIYWSTAGFMVRQSDETIEAEISGLAERYRLDGVSGLSSLIAERVTRGTSDVSLYLLADARYRPIVGNLDRWPAAQESPDGWIDFKLRDAGVDGGTERRGRVRHFTLRGGFHLLVGRDVHDLDIVQQRIVVALAWGLAITVVLALVGGTMMSRSTVRRIEAINATSRDIMSGDLSRRIPGQGTDDDFDKLTDNLNRMLDQMQSLMAGVRQVSDNIAHDLRTPLARLRNRLETVRDGSSPDDREAVEQAVAEADGLLSTFSALLRIARIESGARTAGFENLDMAELLHDVFELYEPLAEEKDQRVEMSVESGIIVRGDRDLLFQAFANLLDNAVKYAPVGGCVSVASDRIEADVSIVVSDDGPGIAREARERVFERFVRLEASRNTPGNGLGLSLVAAVAKLHGANVKLDDNKSGLRVTVTLPAAEGASGSAREPRVHQTLGPVDDHDESGHHKGTRVGVR